MVNLNILNKKIKCPTKLNEISLEKGIMIMEMLGNKEPEISLKKAIISLLTGLDTELVAEFEDESVIRIYSLFDFAKPEIVIDVPTTFKLGNKIYGLVDFDKLTVREYGDIELWLSQGDSPFSYLNKLIPIVYRPLSVKKRSFKFVLNNVRSRLFYKGIVPILLKDYKTEKLDPEYEDKEEFSTKMDFSFGYAILNQIYKMNMDLKRDYPILYPNEEQEEELSKLDDDYSFMKTWGMYGIINEITTSLSERDLWYERPIRELYKYLSYLKQKGLYQQRENG